MNDLVSSYRNMEVVEVEDRATAERFGVNVWGKTCNASAGEVARFQRLFPNPNWLMPGRTSGHQKLVPTFSWIDNCFMVT